jgi:endonuclease YncB( thermonuclease family)
MIFAVTVFILGAILGAYEANAAKIKYPGPYTATIERVIDGDTVVVLINVFPSLFARLSVRVNGVDTPESLKRFSKCEKEQLLGLEAKHFVKNIFKTVKYVKLTNVKFGKYAGRVLADIDFKYKGKMYNLSKLLISKGYAREYHGRKKSDWCT